MRRPGLVWASLLGGLAVLDLYCDRRRDETTLSCCTRRLVGSLPGGRVMFTAGCVVVPLWFHRHILSPLAEASSPDLHPIDRTVRLLDGLRA